MNADGTNATIFAALERMGNLIRGLDRERGAVLGLHPVHLQVLWFLGRANRYSDTPASVAEYLGVTRGTASSTIRVLRQKDLVVERKDRDDRRVTRLALSPAGRRLLESELLPRAFDEAAAELGENAPELERLLVELLGALQRQTGARAFGVCASCQFFTPEGSRFRCGLTGEPLEPVETGLLCRDHLAADDAGDRESRGKRRHAPLA